MKIEDLRKLSQTELNNYLWRRLRLEEPMDPPLDRRFRMESPEDIFIRAVQSYGDQDPLRSRILKAIDNNLTRFIKATAGQIPNEPDNEQLASLAFLASNLNAHELRDVFYRTAIYAGVVEYIAQHSYFHLLRTLALLQTGRALTPFWTDLLQDGRPIIRAIAYYGLSRSAPELVLRHLRQLVDDRELDLPPIVWHLATEMPGVVSLAKASRARLTRIQQSRLLNALREAGADGDMLRDFRVETTKALPGFAFPVAAPVDPEAAKRPPSWPGTQDLPMAA